MIDKGEYVASVFFDLSKAFDKVWPEVLLAKLQAAGIKGSAFKWFQNYLVDRYQKTTVRGVVSAPSQLHAGVRQGAILSKSIALFNLYE